MRVLLVSTYELGRQPFGLASPAAWLREAGFDVRAVDNAKEPLTDEDIGRADLVAFYLPMHTATRLGTPLIARVRERNPAARLCCYGLYAPPNARLLRSLGVEDILDGEFEADLLAIAEGMREANLKVGSTVDTDADRRADEASLQAGTTAERMATGGRGGAGTGRPADWSDHSGGTSLQAGFAGTPKRPALPRLQFRVPDRRDLPPLARYASLQIGAAERRVVGYTEASRGCKHFCRHCPVVPVYQGRFRPVPIDVVLADIRAQVAAGAEHITFGDPDFFNGPRHALAVVASLAREFPGLTYDVTIKIEHLLKHAAHLSALRDSGCLFVTSAVESVDDRVLALLEKGHTRDDFERAVGLCRDAGLTLAPTFVAFHPWITLDGYCELLRAIEALDLVDHVAPIQLALRLLVPEGSRLLELAEVRRLVGPFDPVSLTYPWRHPDARVDDLQQEVMTIVGARLNTDRREVFARIRTAAHARAGLEPPPFDLDPAPDRATVPYLNEPWYC